MPNTGIYELSGFSVIDTPSPKPVPDQVTIKRIDEGPHPHTAKIFIQHLGQSPLTYIVQSSLTPNVEDSWKQVLMTTNSKELLISKLTKGQECWYRVNASNNNGSGLWSNPASFISLH